MTRRNKKFSLIAIFVGVFMLSVAFVVPSLYPRAHNIYEKIQVLNQIISLINENYVEPVDWNKVMNAAFHGLLEGLDPHSAYIPKERLETINEQFRGKFEGIGIEFDLLGGYITVIAPVAGSPSERAGLMPGDQIVEIEGKSAYKITKEEVFKKLRGPKGTKVTITVKRPGLDELLHFQITRDVIPIVSVTVAFMLDDKTGYIRLNRFASGTSEEVKEAVRTLLSQGMVQLIFDLRTNSGGYLEQAVDVADQFITTEDTLVYTQGRIKNSRQVYLANPGRGYNNFALLVLINRWSASASEIVAGAIQDLDRGLIVGETSFGKGLVQRQYRLRDDSALRVTIARYYTPSGRLIQRPYKDGTYQYYTELADVDREAVLDSLKETRPRYRTAAGRIVYGGGGITPDVYLPPKRLTASTQRIMGSPNRLTFNWGMEFAASHKDEWASLEEFRNSFDVTDGQLAGFMELVRDKGVEYDEGDIKEDADYLKTVLKAEIAGAIWGKEAFYETHVLGDHQVREAQGHFNEAWAFLAVHE